MKGGTEQDVYAGGLRWNVASSGPDDGAPVLLLHGFPEQWRSWRKQIPAFTEVGMRVHAADMPGYAGTDAPEDYSYATLAEHVADLARELGAGSVHLVGHDWGGIVAHVVAAQHPDVVRSLVVASAPHPDVMARALRDPQQLAKSWYVILFQIPGIEYLAGSSFVVERIFGGASAGIHDREGMRRAIAYYRANMIPWRVGREVIGRVTAPGLVIYAGQDNNVGENLMQATCEMFDDLRDYVTLDGGHFIQRAKADDFNATVIGFWRDIGAVSE